MDDMEHATEILEAVSPNCEILIVDGCSRPIKIERIEDRYKITRLTYYSTKSFRWYPEQMLFEGCKNTARHVLIQMLPY